MHIVDVSLIRTEEELLSRSKWLEGKTLKEVMDEISLSDEHSRVIGKANVGYVIEKGFFNIQKNSKSEPDIPHLGIEIKTIPLKFNASRTMLTVKEPTSLNIINYVKEAENIVLEQSSMYKKNKTILFVAYIHDATKLRSEYLIKYVFLWKMNQEVLDELTPDYLKILTKINKGMAHEIHQTDHEYLTLCPKHGGTFKDPLDAVSKTKQPYSDKPAEVRAFRLKNKYFNKTICEQFGFELTNGYWKA